MIAAILVATLAGPDHISVDASRVLNRVTPFMYGSCIEDVNHEIYGGLYAQQIFGESFEEPGGYSGIAGWRSVGGTWQSDGKTIRGEGDDGPILFLSRPGFTDGEVTANLRVEKGDGNAGLLVRVGNPKKGADNFDGYEISFRARTRQLALSRHCHDYHLLAEVSAPIRLGETHQVRVSLAGQRIRIYLDGDKRPWIDFTDADTRLTKGGIGLRPWQATCDFSDVTIAGKPIALSLQKSGVSGLWSPIGLGSFAQTGGAYNGRLCQKIQNKTAPGTVGVANFGLNRWGISVTKARTMEGRVYLRGGSTEATVALQSEDGTQTYASARLSVSSGWKKRAFKLTPTKTDPHARFAILLKEKGTIYADEAVLLAADKFKGLPICGDIARAMVREKLRFLRYGGTMVNVPGYRWKNMIGNPDRRPPYEGNWYPYSTNGFGIFDFLNFCEAAHFGAAFAINVEETPQDAADLADYLTAPVTTKWGAKRAADGHPAPYHPDYIELGNEEAIGNVNHATMAHYAERFRLLEHAIHSRNPHLKLVCAAWWEANSADMKTVFDAIDGGAAAWDIHVNSDDPNAGEGIYRDLNHIRSLFKTWNPKTKLKVVVFEENGNMHNLQRALGHATTINATRRLGDFVIADCPANCLQPWLQNDNGWDQGQVFFTPDHAWAMPPYDAQRILSEDYLPLRVAAKSDSGLDVVACRSEDGNSLALTVVNTADHEVQARISINNFHPKTARCRTLAGDLGATNPPVGKPSVSVHLGKVLVRGNVVTFTIPAYSLNSLSLHN